MLVKAPCETLKRVLFKFLSVITILLLALMSAKTIIEMAANPAFILVITSDGFFSPLTSLRRSPVSSPLSCYVAGTALRYSPSFCALQRSIPGPSSVCHTDCLRLFHRCNSSGMETPEDISVHPTRGISSSGSTHRGMTDISTTTYGLSCF